MVFHRSEVRPCFVVCAGSIPAELGALSNLASLGLQNNKLSGEKGGLFTTSWFTYIHKPKFIQPQQPDEIRVQDWHMVVS